MVLFDNFDVKVFTKESCGLFDQLLQEIDSYGQVCCFKQGDFFCCGIDLRKLNRGISRSGENDSRSRFFREGKNVIKIRSAGKVDDNVNLFPDAVK